MNYKVGFNGAQGISNASKSRILNLSLGCAAAALTATVAPASATVYDVNRTIEGGSVVGTITTDGTTGVINPSNFIAWNLELSGPGSTVTISSGDAQHIVYGQGVTLPLTQPVSPSISLLATAGISYFSRS